MIAEMRLTMTIDGKCDKHFMPVISSDGRCEYCYEELRNPIYRQMPHKCPVCDGTGKVSRPPHVPGDVNEWTSGTGTGYPYTCNACNGKGVIWG
jgi:DnaJ-class molecular chaperone